MKRIIPILAALVLTGLFTTAVAYPGFCGWEIERIDRGCDDGYYFECYETYTTIMRGDGSFECIYDIECRILGECDQVAGDNPELPE